MIVPLVICLYYTIAFICGSIKRVISNYQVEEEIGFSGAFTAENDEITQGLETDDVAAEEEQNGVQTEKLHPNEVYTDQRHSSPLKEPNLN